ncbi:MAG: hypothetical protein ACJ8DI_14505 [Ktedonobacteraceae bacterium]
MEVTIVCVPFQVDVARWGCARGPQAFLDAGIAEQIEVRGHSIRKVVWIELPKKEVVEGTGHFVLLKGQTKHTPLLKFDNKLPTTHISRKRLAKLRNVGSSILFLEIQSRWIIRSYPLSHPLFAHISIRYGSLI